MSRLRRAFTSEKKPATPVEIVPRPKTLTAAQQKEQANDKYWQEVEEAQIEEFALASDPVGAAPAIKGKGREIERLWGLENFGNTCYCNSVLQALFACEPFRQFVESYPNVPPPIAALGPPPGSELFQPIPLSQRVTVDSFGLPGGPSSPIANKGNPFDNPSTNSAAKVSSPTPGKEKRGWGGLGRKASVSNAATPSIQTSLQSPTGTSGGVPPTPTVAAKLDLPIVVPDPNRPPPTVFETVQTLFHHLVASQPHQPISVKKPADNSQTASLLPAQPADGSASPNGSGSPLSPSAGVKPEIPQGPPLLASLPPPSAPRGGGPYAAGSLGRGVVRPEDLLKTVKSANEMFRGMAQQDAHEFLGWLLNRVAEEIEMLDRSLRAEGKEVTEAKGFGTTFVQNLFEGVLTNETRCLSCETTSSRDELFLDLSIDIEQHTSVTSCLRQFSASEMLCQKNKFFCDSCCGLQEAEKRMKIKRLPNVLALHLKRFKYQEHLGRYTKLFYRVPFPLELKLPNTSDDVVNPDRLYELFAVVVHIGNGPHHGHYVALVRSAGRWVMCDDENVEPIDESDVFRYFGDYPSGAGYVLFYQAVDLDLKELGMKNPPKPRAPPAERVRTKKPSPTPASVLASNPVRQPTNLMDLEEEDHEHVTSREQAKPFTPSSPFAATSPPIRTSPTRPKVDIPTSPTPVSTNGYVSSPVPRSAVTANGTRSPSAERAPPMLNRTDTSSTKNKEKDGGKWLSRMTGKDKDVKEKETRRMSFVNGAAASPARSDAGVSPTPPPRISRQTTSNTVQSMSTSTPTATTPGLGSRTSSTTFGGLGVNIPTAIAGDRAQSVSSPSPTPTPTPARNGTAAPPLAPPVLSPGGAASDTNLSGSTPKPININTASNSAQVPGQGQAASASPSGISSSIMSSSSASSTLPPLSSSQSKPPMSLGRKPSTTGNSRDRTVSGSSNTSGSGVGGAGYNGGGGLSRRLSGMSGKFKMGFGKKAKDKETEGIEEEERDSRKGLLR